MLYIRSVLFTLGYNLTGVLFGLIAIIIWPIMPYSWRWRIVTCWNRFVMAWLFICCGIRFEVTGKRHNELFPCVILAKHQSSWETMFLQYYFGPVSTIVKKELLYIPFFGWGLASLRSIAIERKAPIKALKDLKSKGIDLLKKGNNLLIFPEGTRVPVGEIGNYARSGADIAISAAVPIIAVAHNAGEFWPNKNFLKYPGTVKVVISAPIYSEGRERRELTEEVKTWIEAEMDRILRAHPSRQKSGMVHFQ